MKRIDISLTEKQIDELKKMKKISGISVSELIRRAIDAHFLFSKRKAG